MSFLGTIAGWVTGEDVNGAQAQSDAADAHLKAINDARYAADLANGTITQATYDEVQAHEASGQIDAGAEILGAGIGGAASAALHPVDAFSEGLAWEGETAGNLAGQVVAGAGRGFNAGSLALLRNIPLSFWVIGILIALYYFGGLGFLKKAFKK